ncbi:MAG: response regulator [Roseibacillus sp.]|jgi:CheY-like chemotaxis protein
MTKKRVLLVDDEISFTSVVKINLETTGNYEVGVENDSSKAIDTAQSFQPDIIILDIVMPGMDGGDLKRKISSTPELEGIPILFVTALASPDEASGDPVVRSPDGAMLAKPVTTEVLVDTIEKCLAGEL